MPTYFSIITASLLISSITFSAQGTVCTSSNGFSLASSPVSVELASATAPDDQYSHRGSGRRDLAQCA